MKIVYIKYYLKGGNQSRIMNNMCHKYSCVQENKIKWDY